MQTRPIRTILAAMKKLIYLVLMTFLANSLFAQDRSFLFETDKFKIVFPQKPVDTIQTIHTSLGDMAVHVIAYKVPAGVTDENSSYYVIEQELPDTTVSSDKKNLLESYFSGVVDQFVSSSGGRLIAQKSINSGRFPGKEFSVDIKNGAGIVTVRSYLVHYRTYALRVITQGKKAPNPSIEKFMNSFTAKP